MTKEIVKNKGTYLGFCEQKGYIYSIFKGCDSHAKKEYYIVSILNNQVSYLIDFTGTN